MPYVVPPELATLSLAQVAEAVAARRLPPISEWQPRDTIDSGMRIDAQGRWFHDGRPLIRPAMVRAFASLLLRDGAIGGEGQHWLMTPDCRQSIMVEDAAFMAVDMHASEGAIAFRLNTDELVLAGPENPLRSAGTAECPAVYLAVRHGCEARLNRSTWLQLAEHALAGDDGLHVTSLGARFALLPQ